MWFYNSANSTPVSSEPEKKEPVKNSVQDIIQETAAGTVPFGEEFLKDEAGRHTSPVLREAGHTAEAARPHLREGVGEAAEWFENMLNKPQQPGTPPASQTVYQETDTQPVSVAVPAPVDAYKNGSEENYSGAFGANDNMYTSSGTKTYAQTALAPRPAYTGNYIPRLMNSPVSSDNKAGTNANQNYAPVDENEGAYYNIPILPRGLSPVLLNNTNRAGANPNSASGTQKTCPCKKVSKNKQNGDFIDPSALG